MRKSCNEHWKYRRLNVSGTIMKVAAVELAAVGD